MHYKCSLNLKKKKYEKNAWPFELEQKDEIEWIYKQKNCIQNIQMFILKAKPTLSIT